MKHSALCLSGGGIRSATFALGVLQALAEKGILKDFTYLSTVSGGGYIGAWLSSWIQRTGQSPATVASTLADSAQSASPDRPAARPAPPRAPHLPLGAEPATIQHLRRYSNYLTPALGLLSGDGWAVAATVARNLLLNWFLIIPALLLVLLLPRFALGVELHAWCAQPCGSVLVAAGSFLAGLVALSNLVARRGQTQGEVLRYCILPLVLFCALGTLAWFWAQRSDPLHAIFSTLAPSLPPGSWRHWVPGHLLVYVGWGAVTGALAERWGLRIRKKQKLGDDLQVRGKLSLCLIAVFSLTGLATWWIGEHAAGYLRPPAGVSPAPAAAGAPSPAAVHTTAPATPPPTWTLLSHQKDDSRIAAWVAVDPKNLPVQNWAEEFWKGPAPATARQVRLQVAILCVCFGFPLLLSVIFLANTVLTGLLSRVMLDADREWFSRATGWAFLIAVLSCVLNLLVLHGPVWLVALWAHWPKVLASIAGGSGLLTIGGGQRDKVAASSREEKKPGSPAWLLTAAVRLAAPIFIGIFLMLFSLVTTVLLQKLAGSHGRPQDHWFLLQNVGLRSLLAATAFLGFVVFFANRFVNINKFSLHAMYRDRLIRAYLGATNANRNANRFTGFDEKDDMPIVDLRGQRPFHVLNAALNLVGGAELAWQQRLAMSFTFTPLNSGSAILGYRDSEWYARGLGSSRSGMTLGTALAISGAAVSPNHGYNSSPLIAFLLTFFNARLGGWFGNPGPPGQDTWRRAAPKEAMQPLVDEAFGLTDADHPYVYLSDGGHFENLGLYEMVLRRCRLIVVSDAGCDPKYWFEDLGNAIAKIRVDFGIPITFQPNIDVPEFSPDPDAPGRRLMRHHCAVARIYYSAVDGPAPRGKDRDGYLVYIKPAMCGKEPMDVYHYHREHPDFPHEPTTDQWFSESQFESYRALGYHSIQEICGPADITGLAAFVRHAAIYARTPSAGE